MSKLSRFCDGVMEAGWLAALAVAPLLVNIHSKLAYESDKIACLRSLALIILAAWITRGVDQWDTARPGGRWRAALKTPLVRPALIVALSVGVATVCSLDPSLSWWGSFERRGGGYTLGCFLVIFGAIGARLRTTAQLERLVSTIIVTSLPVTLYGLLQRAGYDLVEVERGGYAQRVGASLGAPIFLAPYLALVLPLTLWRLLGAAQRGRGARTAAGFVAPALYGGMALLQALVIFYTESRGAILGMLAALGFALVLFATWQKRWKLFLPVVAAAGLGVIFLALLNVPNGPLESLRKLPVLARFSELGKSGQTSSSWRSLVWHNVPRLLFSRAPRRYPDAPPDALRPARFLIGYGPETIKSLTVDAGVLAGLSDQGVDRFHNLGWDLWVTTGALGFFSFLAFFAVIFYRAYTWLGWVRAGGETWLFIALAGGSATVGAGLGCLWDQGYATLGLQLGLLAGLTAFPPLARWRSPDTSPASLAPSAALLLAALLAALVTHLVETGFSFQVAATSLLFWVYAGLLLAVGYFSAGVISVDESPAAVTAKEPSVSPSPLAAKKDKRARHSHTSASAELPKKNVAVPAGLDFSAIGFSAAVTSFILVSVVFFLMKPWASRNIGEILRHDLLQLAGRDGSSYFIPALLAVTWLGATGGLVGGGAGRRTPATLGWSLLLSGVTTGLFLLLLAGTLGATSTLADYSADSARQLLAGREKLYFLYLGALLLWVLAAGLVHGASGERTPLARRPFAPVLGVAALLAALALAWGVNVAPIRADLAFRLADYFHRRQQWSAATSLLERAAALAPRAFMFQPELAAVRQEEAAATRDPARFNALLQQAETGLRAAQYLPGADNNFFRLGLLYRQWALRAPDAAARRELAEQASRTIDQALEFSPANAHYWNASAELDLHLLDQPARGLEKNQRATRLDPAWEGGPALAGDYYSARSADAQNPADIESFARTAIAAYRAAEKQSLYPYPYQMAEGRLQLVLHDPASAQACFEIVAKSPTDLAWRGEEMLARMAVDRNDRAAALAHLDQALARVPANAPASARAGLQNFRDELQKRP